MSEATQNRGVVVPVRISASDRDHLLGEAEREGSSLSGHIRRLIRHHIQYPNRIG